MTVQKRVLAFIKPFRNDACRTVFTEGYCYWFAWILQEWSVHIGAPGVIEYEPIMDHFACRIDGVLYDVTGVVTETFPFTPWDEFKQQDSLLTKRIIRDDIIKV